MKKIPVYQPMLSGNEKKYVDDCLDTSWISAKGKYVNMFEENFAKYIGCNYGCAVANGTLALHLAMLALGIGPGDEVIVPTFTYIASVNCIKYVGAIPVFADSERKSWQLDPADVESKITKNTKAVIAVDLYGQPCDMDRLVKICKDNKIFLIEDCAEAIGSEWKGQKVGSFGDISCFSFFGNKTITCGEGGMVLTNDKTLIERARHLKGQGLAEYREYWHDTIGYNFRMTNIQAAIGCAQLEKIEEHIKMKESIFAEYAKNLKETTLELNSPVGPVRQTFWMVTILVEKIEDRDPLREFMKERGIETRPAFYPIHTMPMYSERFQKYPVAEDISWRGINVPSWPGLSNEDIGYVCDAIKDYYKSKKDV